ncbi:hypothetical protein MTR_3g118480 [Medicago truncatula]|uniref:Uncharacterized protein n=1 Tax=Medicago truncatula TaxID=3880 RepID=G7J9A5_MEDTR|nr:hypothetical protein MTR_3g118480 [Medicago truncatula]
MEMGFNFSSPLDMGRVTEWEPPISSTFGKIIGFIFRIARECGLQSHQILNFPKALFGSLEGRVLEKRNEQVEEIEDIGRRGLWRLIFYS